VAILHITPFYILLWIGSVILFFILVIKIFLFNLIFLEPNIKEGQDSKIEDQNEKYRENI